MYVLTNHHHGLKTTVAVTVPAFLFWNTTGMVTKISIVITSGWLVGVGIGLTDIIAALSDDIISSHIIVPDDELEDGTLVEESQDIRPLGGFTSSILNCGLFALTSNGSLDIGILNKL